MHQVLWRYRPRHSPRARTPTENAGHRRGLREFNVTPHVAQNTTKLNSAIEGRATKHDGNEMSTLKIKQVEEAFGSSGDT